MNDEFEIGDVVMIGAHAPCYDMIDGMFEIRHKATKIDIAGHNITGYLVTYKEMLVWIDRYMVVEFYRKVPRPNPQIDGVNAMPSPDTPDDVGDVPF